MDEKVEMVRTAHVSETIQDPLSRRTTKEIQSNRWILQEIQEFLLFLDYEGWAYGKTFICSVTSKDTVESFR